jgi:hypothetical protein
VADRARSLAHTDQLFRLKTTSRFD